MRLFEPHADGIRMRLPETLVAFLRDVPAVLLSVGTPAEDPAATRLSVPVYLDDPEADAEFWRWMRTDLDEGRRSDRSAFVELLEAAAVSEPDGEGTLASRAEAEAFLRVLAEVRLVLAARMGVEVEADYENLDDTQSDVLDMVAELQILLIQALST